MKLMIRVQKLSVLLVFLLILVAVTGAFALPDDTGLKLSRLEPMPAAQPRLPG